MANGAVSQRMNILLAQVESFYAELMTKMLKMAIIFNTEDDPVFVFPYKDGVGALTQEDVVGNSLVRVKLASRIKVEQQEQSQNALMVLQTLAPLSEQGVDVKRLISTLVPVITQNVVNRRTAESFVSDDLKIDPAQLNAAINRSEAKRRARQLEGPITEDFMAQATPEQITDLENMARQAIGGATRGELGQTNPSMAPSTPSSGQQPQLPTGADQMTAMPSGMSPDMAGQMANTNQNLGIM